MGRRSINTTKRGKYMNPTDQVRKEARRKELKKNKRHRQMIRAAILRNKDPFQILQEMKRLDDLEYNVLQPSPVNENVLNDKRKKLKDTLNFLMRFYQQNKPELCSKLKRKQENYEKRRLEKQQYFESVKLAQMVNIDEIPLPAYPPTHAVTAGSSRALGAPPDFIENSDEFATFKSLEGIVEYDKDKESLGVPPGPPPNLFEMSDLDTDAEDDKVELKHYSPPCKSSTPNSLQQHMHAEFVQNIDKFMKEVKNVHKIKHADIEEQSNEEDEKSSAQEPPLPLLVHPPPLLPSGFHNFVLRAPPGPPAGSPPVSPLRPPPRPPPGLLRGLPPGPPTGSKPYASRNFPQHVGYRMKKGPLRRLPPRYAKHLKKRHPRHPTLSHNKDPKKVITSITAKPQIRNISSDITRFVPTTLLIKREEVRKRPQPKSYTGGHVQDRSVDHNPTSISTDERKSTIDDDIYMQFMNEIRELG